MRQKLHDFLVLEEATLHPDLLCPVGFQFPERLIVRPVIHIVWGQEEKGTTEDEMAGWHH